MHKLHFQAFYDDAFLIKSLKMLQIVRVLLTHKTAVHVIQGRSEAGTRGNDVPTPFHVLL